MTRPLLPSGPAGRGSAASRRGRSSTGAATEQRVDVDPLLEDRLFQTAQLGAGVDAQLLAQHGARPLIGAQRVALPTRPIEGEHQQPPQPLPQRVARRPAASSDATTSVPAGGDLGLQLELDRGTPELGEPAHLRLGEPLEDHVGEGLAPPQRQRRRGGRRTVSVSPPCERGPGFGPPASSTFHHDGSPRRVPRPHRAHRVAAEPLAELRDVVLEHPGGGGRRVVTPQVVDQAIAAYDLAAVEQQVDQQRRAASGWWARPPAIPQ